MDNLKDNTQNETDFKEGEFKVPTLIGLRAKKKNVPANELSESKVSEKKIESGENKKDLKTTDKEPVKEKTKKNEPISLAEKLKLEMSSSFSYKEPSWGGIGADSGKYKLEVIKEGTKIDEISLDGKSMFVFGRLQSCDHQMDHPTISRHHAVFQYRLQKGDDDQSKSGWYLYDLDSTHGTFVNKQRIKSEVFVRLRVGYVIKFGGSTRLFVVDGPPDDCDQETELSFADMTRMKEEAKLARKMKEMAEDQESERQNMSEAFSKRNEFCTWGMDDDAAEENPDAENPYADSSLTDESLYLDDPKKSIKGFFEREGLDAPDYEFVEDNSTFGLGSRKKCRLELPIDNSNGRPIYAEVPVDGKRREAIVACALEACRILDKMGLLRQATHESRSKKRKKDWAENDYYDSDEDSFFDRTGDLEKKREKRMKKNQPGKSETHESLTAKLAEVTNEITEIELGLSKDEELNRRAKASLAADNEECDALDAFMKTVKLGGLSVKTKMSMKARLTELRHTRTKLESLIAIAKPFEVKIAPNPTEKKPTPLALFGKNKFSKLNLPKPEDQLRESIKEERDAEDEEEDGDKNPKDDSPSAINPPVKIEAESSPDQPKSRSEEIKPAPREPPKPNSKTDSKKRKRSLSKTDESSLPPLPSAEQPIGKVSGVSDDLPDSNSKACTEEELLKSLPEESSWLPPEDQVGDGRTKLNEMFGYWLLRVYSFTVLFLYLIIKRWQFNKVFEQI